MERGRGRGGGFNQLIFQPCRIVISILLFSNGVVFSFRFVSIRSPFFSTHVHWPWRERERENLIRPLFFAVYFPLGLFLVLKGNQCTLWQMCQNYHKTTPVFI